MQTERVTFLTTAEHKAMLESFARNSGMSVGHILREASARYVAQPPQEEDETEAALTLLLDELEAAIPKWNAKFDSMEASLDRTHEAVRQALADVEATR